MTDSALSRELIDSLLAAHRHGGGDAMELLETHISWVLLTGTAAYKVKKPVRLPFVDFSSLERREFFCREELRLNRRLAPELYLEVVPITGTPDAPRLEGAGTPIEFAVKMRRFPQESLLSRVLHDGRLHAEHVDDLAAQVAEFHQHIDRAAADVSFGSLKCIREQMQENFEFLDRAVSDAERSSQLDRLRTWSEREFETRRETFTQRRRDGFIREGHGDMHLGNIILHDGRVVIFDAIEFNEGFRWIDVQSDLAFLVMDLEDRGRPDFARRCLNAYLERTGDYGGLAALPFYLAYRALVRAKVAGIRFGQSGLSDDDRAACRRELHGYLDLAERFTRPPRPVLLITHGVSGSGKTTGTQRILETTGAVRVRSDVERKRLLGLSPSDRPDMDQVKTLYSPAIGARTYERLAQSARAIMEAGHTAIVDATFLKRSHRAAFRRHAKRWGVPFRILEFQADEAELRRRVAERTKTGTDASDADLAVLTEQLAAVEPLNEDERTVAVTVDPHASEMSIPIQR
ncbi:MAG: AAA family ATPase [Planctomycetaceae bacterium]